MNAQEALEAIKIRQIQIEGNAIRVAKFFEGLSIAQQALEKQIPKKPTVKKLGADIEVKCPNCEDIHIYLDTKKGEKYCCKCGQALDWSDTE